MAGGVLGGKRLFGACAACDSLNPHNIFLVPKIEKRIYKEVAKMCNSKLVCNARPMTIPVAQLRHLDCGFVAYCSADCK